MTDFAPVINKPVVGRLYKYVVNSKYISVADKTGYYLYLGQSPVETDGQWCHLFLSPNGQEIKQYSLSGFLYGFEEGNK